MTLDEQGWVDIDILLDALNQHRFSLSKDQLFQIVEQNDKQRFTLDKRQMKIRANQGHSIQIQFDYEPVEPPYQFCHGTSQQFVAAICQQGLTKQKRHAVHMHTSLKTAIDVGQRRGVPVVLTINAAEMYEAGHEFFVTPNGVWLTDHVPPQYISITSGVGTNW